MGGEGRHVSIAGMSLFQGALKDLQSSVSLPNSAMLDGLRFVSRRGDTITVDHDYQGLVQDLLPWFERELTAKYGRSISVVFAPRDSDVEAASESYVAPTSRRPSVVEKTGLTFATSTKTRALERVHAIVGGNVQPGYTFLSGQVGSGRTHTLSVLGNERHGVRMVNAAEFIDGMTRAFRNRLIQEFREEFEQYDILAVDDVEQIGGKTKSEELLLHICDAVCRDGGHVVFAGIPTSSHRMTNANLRGRLNSAFSAGMWVPSEPSQRRGILGFMAMRPGLFGAGIPDAVLDYVAEQDWPDLHAMEGALKQLASYGAPMTIRMAEHVLTETAAGEDPAMAIVREVAKLTGVPLVDIMGRSRLMHINAARHTAWSHLQRAGWKLEQIGALFGGRNKGAILRGIRAARSRRSTSRSTGSAN